MRSKHTFAINFLKRNCKNDKTKAIVYARITIDEEDTEISLKERISVSDWDTELEMVNGKSIKAKALNQYIDDVRFKIKEKYRALCDRDLLVTAETVKQAYLGVHTVLKGHKLTDLMAYYKKIWEPKLKPGGFKNIKTTVDYVQRFLATVSSSGDVYLSQVNMQFATNLEHFIRANPAKKHDPCKGNGLAKHLQRFKRMLSWGKEIEWIQAHPCKEYSCSQKKPKRKKLTIQQLITIELQHFPDPEINYVKDLFLHSCYTGFAFAEAMTLREEHFEWHTDGSVWCLIYRQKSDELSAVRILKFAARILNKYRERPDYVKGNPIFPRITNQTVNDKLKIIQAICGIEAELTFHIARHTFAKTVALKNGIPLETVQMFMGHAKIETTKIYADVDEEKIAEDSEGWEEKIERKREIALAARKLQTSSDSIRHWAN